jgi:hypothetical protein
MQIQVWFSNDKYMDVRLFDNNTTAKWFDHCSALNSVGYYGGFINSGFTAKHNKVQLSNFWNSILNAIDQLTKLGYNFPYQIPQEFDHSQSTLNLLHRFFTYNAMWYHDNKADSSILNPFDSKFILPNEMTYVDWLSIIDPINDSVHKIENATEPTDNKKLILNELKLITVYNSPNNRNPADLSPWLPFTEEDQQHNYTYFDSELPLVVLDRSILGKCVLQSFYDDDDLNARDCTGRVGSYGGFCIDLNHNRKKIYRSQEFKTWAEKHNRSVELLPLEFSIGHVVNYDDVMSWVTPSLSVKKLVFDRQDK